MLPALGSIDFNRHRFTIAVERLSVREPLIWIGSPRLYADFARIDRFHLNRCASCKNPGKQATNRHAPADQKRRLDISGKCESANRKPTAAGKREAHSFASTFRPAGCVWTETGLRWTSANSGEPSQSTGTCIGHTPDLRFFSCANRAGHGNMALKPRRGNKGQST